MDAAEKHMMEPLNNRLPIEVLWVIFDMYSAWDGIEDPLEKLLHICKNWSNAAQQHKALWSSFAIVLSSERNLRFWSSCVANRLAICGEDTFLDIKIKMEITSLGKNTKQEWQTQIMKISRSLIGADGSLVKQWRRLRLSHLFSEFGTIWNEALALPTPNLRSFEACDLFLDQPILPYAPLLEEFTAVCSSGFGLSGPFDKLRIITLNAWISNLEIALRSQSLTTLSLRDFVDPIQFPSTLPALKVLSLNKEIKFEILEHFSAPKLNTLILRLRPTYSWNPEYLTQCAGINLGGLKKLAIQFYLSGDACDTHTIERGILGLKDIVHAATNVDSFIAYDALAISILILCFQENLHSGTRSRGCTIKVYYDRSNPPTKVNRTFCITHQTIQEDISRIRSYLLLPEEEETWEALIARWIAKWRIRDL
jgi:hypothetical protein